jgi:hypothetical protein
VTTKPFLLAAVVAAGLALTGCASSASTGTSGSPSTAGSLTPSHAAKPSCDAAPAAMVNAALGTNVKEPTAQNLNTVVVCTYLPVSGSGAVILRIQTDMTNSTFKQARSVSDANGLPTTDLPGLGDQAYTSTLSAGSVVTNTVVALKGTVQILVSSPAKVDAEQAFVKQLFDKLT